MMQIIKGDKEYILLRDGKTQIVCLDILSLFRCICITLDEKIPDSLKLSTPKDTK